MLIHVKTFEEQSQRWMSDPRSEEALCHNKKQNGFPRNAAEHGQPARKDCQGEAGHQNPQYELPEIPGPEYGPAIQRLKEKYALLNEMEQAKNSKDERIEEISSEAYPEIAELLGRNRKEIVAILKTGSEETAPPQGEASKQHQEDDTRRQQDTQAGTKLKSNNPIGRIYPRWSRR